MCARFRSFALSLVTVPQRSADQLSQAGLRCLRRIAALLALCVAWSFAVGPAAMAAQAPVEAGVHGTVARPQPPSIVQIWRDAQWTQRKQERQDQVRAEMQQALVNADTALARSRSRSSVSRRPRAVTRLDTAGRLARPVPAATVAAWKRELNGPASARPAPARLATLHLWLGEWELAASEQPRLAQWHFRAARLLTQPANSLYGLSAYDDALADFDKGAYADAAAAFRHLLLPKTARPGYDRRTCALWYRHAAACNGYHQEHAHLGIPEPVQLDPLCGVAALAAALRALDRSYDKKTLLAACRVTGEGSNLADLVAAGPKLGVSVRAVDATEEGLRALPKPLVAYIEHDHFVSVVRADARGVSYLCSDCGMWPGGRVDLTWRQWRTLNPGVYAAVTLPGGRWDRALSALGRPPSAAGPGVQVATGLPGALGGPRRVLPLLPTLPSLRGVSLRITTNPYYSCGSKYVSPRCPPIIHCPLHYCIPCNQTGGPAAGDPVNLATGEEEYAPAADLTVYNPHGPSLTWQRVYYSLDSDVYVNNWDFGDGWSDTYNIYLSSNADGSGCQINFANGSYIPFTQSGYSPTVGNPIRCQVPPGVPLLVYYNYAASGDYYTITFPDRTTWVIASDDGLGQIIDRNGNAITFNRDANGFLTSITNTDGTALLTITRNPNNYSITAVSDCYGRSVYYQGANYANYAAYPYELTGVSQVVPTGTVNAVTQSPRYVYGYNGTNPNNPQTNYINPEGYIVQFLQTITVPSPAGGNTSTAYITYDPSTENVSSIQDGNGNTTSITSVDDNHTQVTVSGTNMPTPYSYTVGYDNNMSETTETDGAGHTISSNVYSDPNDPYTPSSVTDGNGNTWSYTYDQYGNMQTETPPNSGVRVPAMTVNTYSYTNFALGELTQTQVGSKTPTAYAYYEPSGLVGTVTGPQPGTTGASAIVLGAYTYDALGNVTSLKAPGPNSTPAATTGSSGFSTYVTTTLSYTADVAYITTDGTNYPARSGVSDAIGEPLAVTDPLGHTTHLRYAESVPYEPVSGTPINRGHATSVTDAGNSTKAGDSGDETQMAYNIDDRPLSTVYPKTGQSGSGHGRTANQYLYDESGDVGGFEQYGPLADVQTFDEGNTVGAFRQVNYAYGPEGETLGVGGSTEPAAYTYDALYRLASLTDGGGHATRYFYNAAGYLYQTAYPLSGAGSTPLAAGSSDTVTYTSYDGAGDVTARVDGNGTTTAYTYNDPESLLTKVHYTLPASPPSYITSLADTNYAYDVYGRRHTMADATGTQAYTYDDADATLTRAFTYTGLPTRTIAYAYDPDASRATMSLTGVSGSFAYSYDNAGREMGLTNPYGQHSAWAYLNNNWLQGQTSANGATATYIYNARGQMTDLKNVAGGSTVSEFRMAASGSYDGAGNRTGMACAGTLPGAVTYQYDGRDELTQEASTRTGASYTDTQHYDGVTSGTTTGPGNPTTLRGAGHSYDADNHDVGNVFNGDGSPTTYYGNSLKYDPESRLTSFGGTQTNTYTGDSLRAQEFWSGGAYAAYFLYDGDQMVAETDSTGAVNVLHTWGANGLVSRRQGSVDEFYAFDPSGNCADRLTGTGAVATAQAVDGFGSQRASSTDDPYGGLGGQWGGHADVATGQDGLLLLTHREYDPYAGRFLTRDPIGYRGGVNLYGYTQNDPVNRADPDGHFAIVIAAGVVIIIGLAAYYAYWAWYWSNHPPVFPNPTYPPPTMTPPILAPPIAVPPVMPVKVPDNPAEPPGPDWTWRGTGEPGTGQGNWINPGTGESLHPNLKHQPGPPLYKLPHWGYRPGKGCPTVDVHPGGDTDNYGPGF